MMDCEMTQYKHDLQNMSLYIGEIKGKCQPHQNRQQQPTWPPKNPNSAISRYPTIPTAATGTP